MLNFVAVTPQGPGDLRAWPSDQAIPSTSIINYTPGVTIANGIVIPVRQDQEGGDIALYAEVSGTHVLADVVGYFSSRSPTQGSDNLSLGTGAGNPSVSTGNLNTAIGISAMGANTTGTTNTAVGAVALASNTSGPNNTAVGWNALGTNTSGFNNTALGYAALRSCTIGAGNTAVGLGALVNVASGTFNIAIGTNAGVSYTSTESGNILLASAGVAGESHVIRIGDNAGQSSAFLAGVYGSTSSGGTPPPSH